MIDLETLFKFGAESAEHLFRKNGHIIRTWACLNEKGHIHPLLGPTLNEVHDFLKKKKIIAYVSMLEAPGRVDILAVDREGNSISGNFPVLNHGKGRRRTLSPLIRHKNSVVISLFHQQDKSKSNGKSGEMNAA